MLSSLIRWRSPRRDIASLLSVAPTPIAPGVRRIILEGDGIQVTHGENCDAAEGDPIAIEESFDLPDFATQATVFLNGWSLEYLEGDHHVWGAATRITNSRVQGRTLKWKAYGFLLDDGQDDSYKWCYYYTVVAWDSQLIRCTADHNDIENTVASTRTSKLPIVSSSSYSHKGGPFLRRSSVVLPRGFVFHLAINDHHLLHIAYSLMHSENSITRRKHYGDLPQPDLNDATDKVGSGFTTWDTNAILQDNTYRDFVFYHLSSTLGGSGVSVVQPPFTILPTRVEANIGSPTRGETTQEVGIEGVPFDFAVPMLTGWDLRYDFDDEHVKKMGVWLNDIEYEKPKTDEGGTLHYKITSALHDSDKDPNYSFNHNVHILGFSSRPLVVLANPTGRQDPPNRSAADERR